MHPLFLLLPAGLCALFTFAAVIEVVEDVRGGRAKGPFCAALMIALSFSATIVAAVPVALWLAERIA